VIEESGEMQQESFPNMPVERRASAASDVSFQARSSREGRIVREFAQDALAEAGFSLTSAQFEIATTGVEVDIAADDRLGNRWFCEVTGAYGSRRPGLQRTDTVRKLLGSAYLLADWNIRPFLVVTTDLPKPGSRGDIWVRHAGPRIVYDIIVLGRAVDLRRIERYAEDGPGIGPLPGWWLPEDLTGDRVQPDEQLRLLDSAVAATTRGALERRRHFVKFIMPSRDSIGHPIDPVVIARYQKDLVKWLMERNGGQVKQTGEGSWLDNNGAPMDERICILESWGETPVTTSEIQPFVDRMFSELDQLAMTVFIDGEMILLSRDPVRTPGGAGG
jgi:hypothetical protein